MKNSPTFVLAVVAAFALGAAPLAAQQSSTPPPVDVHVTTPVIIKQPKLKLDKYKGRVLAFNIATIVVQSTQNERMVWSFQYSTELRAKVSDMMTSGAYQSGDKVEVYCNPGTTVAVKLKGKPSKPV